MNVQSEFKIEILDQNWVYGEDMRLLITQEKTVPLNRAMPQLKVQILNILDFEGFWHGNSFTLCHVLLKKCIS